MTFRLCLLCVTQRTESFEGKCCRVRMVQSLSFVLVYGAECVCHSLPKRMYVFVLLLSFPFRAFVSLAMFTRRPLGRPKSLGRPNQAV